jgi:hypothetical protein
MATYSALRDRALLAAGCLGQTEAQSVAQMALEEAMKFVAFHVRIPALILSATATAPASPELEANAISLTGGAGTFQIGAGVYQTPDRLFVKASSSVVGYGIPYHYLEYHHFIDLKACASNERIGVYTPATYDERDTPAWTITPTGKVWSDSLVAGNLLTLFYRISPAAYSALATPEILSKYDHIIVNGAILVLKEWLREPDAITTPWTLFAQGLMADIERYDIEINGMRKRTHLKIHRSYRPC